ncbi:ATP-binding protein [Naasia sp. SYSU D00948]|uniref:ATP-binding protein n=1 Tax=Naasia sp. SYSU D00948 TaxID=2817379 RepID=UPI001B31893A|nr:ATP-binding protein [Naasia sp. SYSU D00948]
MPDTVSRPPKAPQTLDLAAPPDDVNSVHALLEAVWAAHEDVGPIDRISFETALIELASNVIRHGDDGDGVVCSVTVDVTEDRIEARLIDSGPRGDIQLSRSELPDELAESGRGIPLITALVDVVRYEHDADGNRWFLSRRRSG